MWTTFWDMHSGGRQKLQWAKIYIEAPEDEAKCVFYNRFGRNPERVTCTCCGEDYSISSDDRTLKQATGHHRGCTTLEIPRNKDGTYQNDHPVIRESLYLDPGDPIPDGFRVDQRFPRPPGDWQSLEDYCKRPDVLVIHASEIKDEERKANIPQEGYVWVE